MSDFITGANQWDHHLCGVNWGRDLPEPHEVADIRNVVEGILLLTAEAASSFSAALRLAMFLSGHQVFRGNEGQLSR